MLRWTTDTDILHLDMMGPYTIMLSSSGLSADLVGRGPTAYSDRVCKRSGIFSMAFVLIGAHW